jgi:acetyl esterase
MFKADADTQRMIDWAAAAGLPPLYTLSPEAARAQSAAGTLKTALDIEPVARVENIDIDGPGGPLPVRIYYPMEAPGGPLPILLYYHGGGFVIGSVETHDSIPRILANRAGAIVVSVEYRCACGTRSARLWWPRRCSIRSPITARWRRMPRAAITRIRFPFASR